MNLFCCNMALNNKITRKWEIFAGRNKFYCDGYFMSAPNTGVFYLTVFLITGTSVLFFAFDCPYLTLQITPAIPIVGALLYFFTMGSLLRTTFTDPGVIPRASQDEAAYIEKQIEVPNSLNSPTYRPPPRTKEVFVKGQTIKLKYCFTCKIFRPPRASHCSLCDNCVDRFDHHCPWVGNCVGKRNYRFFYMFIVSLAFLAVFIFSCSLTHLILLAKNSNDEFVEVIKKAPFSVVVTFICFFSIWSVIGLAGFHTYLTTSDQTTNEDIKGSFSSKGAQHSVNPYTQGNVCLNCFYILCGPMTPSFIDRRGIVTDEYRNQMQSSENYNNVCAPPNLIGQPMDNNLQMHKSKYYEIERDPNNTGIYRQRSYENLEKGNSNSVARLVDNELPVSTLNSPVDEEISTDNYDDDHLDVHSNSNNRSGSYSNLYREKSEQPNNFYLSTESKSTITKEENLYSNIPQNLKLPKKQSTPTSSSISLSSSSSSSSTAATSPQFDKRKANENGFNNLHVYSNVSAAAAVLSLTNSSSSNDNFNATTNDLTDVIITPNNNDLLSKNNRTIEFDDHHHHSNQLLNNDDLDLDEPVIVSSIFGNKQNSFTKISNKTKRLNATKCDHLTATPTTKTATTISSPSSSSISCNKDANINSIDTTLSSDRIGINESMATIEKIPLTIDNSMSSYNNHKMVTSPTNNTYSSPRRMRLLHDTTMIDTALDLDSLDGSSIGNNSQGCLVKTANV